jgi:hypothetical protein
LRIKYPYSKNNPLIDRAVFQSLDESPLITVCKALVEVQVCGELIEKSWGMYMTENQEEEFRSTITAYYIPVKITKIISTKGDFSFINEEEFILCYALNSFFGESAIKDGAEFICFVTDTTRLKKEHIDSENVYESAGIATFYITDDGYVLSVTSDAYVDVYSGYTVRDFENAMKEITKANGW